MEIIQDTINQRIEIKKNELFEQQKQFILMCEKNIQEITFERNAASDLVTMQKLKAEIAELEHLKMIMEHIDE